MSTCLPIFIFDTGFKLIIKFCHSDSNLASTWSSHLSLDSHNFYSIIFGTIVQGLSKPNGSKSSAELDKIVRLVTFLFKLMFSTENCRISFKGSHFNPETPVGEKTSKLLGVEVFDSN